MYDVYCHGSRTRVGIHEILRKEKARILRVGCSVMTANNFPLASKQDVLFERFFVNARVGTIIVENNVSVYEKVIVILCEAVKYGGEVRFVKFPAMLLNRYYKY
jgi:hypothetical protein